MKIYKLLLIAGVLTVSACGINNTGTTGTAGLDSAAVPASTNQLEQGLYAVMQISDTVKAGDPLELKFTVYNSGDTLQQFCKWHTPFEPLMSKYLDVKDENGEEVNYRGAMAKRIMPPPADSYIKVGPKDSLVATIDLLKGYAISKPSRYTIVYSGQNMSGLIVRDSISFVYR